MQNVLSIILTFLFCTVMNSQVTDAPSNPIPQSSDISIYNVVDVKPQFANGPKDIINYIKDNYKVPEVGDLKGNILVQFVVEKDGSLSNIKVIRGLGFGTAAEAVRVLSNCPKWTPGNIKGVPVRVLYSLPISIDSKK